MDPIYNNFTGQLCKITTFNSTNQMQAHILTIKQYINFFLF